MKLEMPESTIEYVIEMAESGMMADHQRERLHASTAPQPQPFDIPTLVWNLSTIIESGKLPEPERARIHALTRKVTMSDEELAEGFRRATFSIGTGPLYGTHWEFIRDLRDRYEEREKYAPESAPLPEFPEGRCRVCGWPIADDIKAGCVPGNCSQRPVPKRRADEGYAPPRASEMPDAKPRR